MTHESEQATEKPQATPGPVIRGDIGIEAAQVWICAFLILVLGLLTWIGVLSIPYHGADHALFVESGALQRVVTFPAVLDELPEGPLALFSLACDHAVWGGGRTMSRMVSLFLHLANGMLLFLLCRRMLPEEIPHPLPMLAGMLFIVHPLATGALGPLVGRSALLGVFFGLLAVLAFLRATMPGKLQPMTAAGSIVAYFLAVGCNTAMLGLPVVFLTAGYIRDGLPGLRRQAALHLSAWGTLVAIAVARHAAVVDAANYAAGMDVLAHQSSVATRFATGLVFPIVPRLIETPPDGWNTPGLILMMATALVAGLAIWRRSMLSLAAIWLLAGLSTLPCVVLSETLLRDRQLYLLLPAIAFLIGWALAALKPPPLRNLAAGLLVVAVLAGAYLSQREAALWQDPVMLWGREADRNPAPGNAWRHAARYLSRQVSETPGERDQTPIIAQAEAAWRKVLETGRGDGEALSALGPLVAAQERFDEAIVILEGAARMLPFDQEVLLQLAHTIERHARTSGDRAALARALDYLRSAGKLGPLPPASQTLLGLLLAGFGDFEGAAGQLRAAGIYAEEQELAPVMKQVAAVSSRIRQIDSTALEQQQDPEKVADALMLQAESALLKMNFLQAAYVLELLLARDPDHVQAWPMLGFARASMEDAGGFLRQWGGKRGGGDAAWTALAQQCAMRGAWDPALQYLEYAAKDTPALVIPGIVLADVALQLRQPQRARALLEEAARKRPQDPAPWLKLCDMAIAAEDNAQARICLAEAEQRGAPEADIASRREKAGAADGRPLQPVRSIIR